jgi:hypothetical protein
MGELEQRIWDRVRCFSEHPWATHWELANAGILKIHPLNPPPPQAKKYEPTWVYAKSLIGCMHILFLDMATTIFLPQLITILQRTPYLQPIGSRLIIVIYHEFCVIKHLASDHFKTIWQRSP